MKMIKQRDHADCAIATIAMVLNKKYEDVAKDFSPQVMQAGLDTDVAMSYFADQGKHVLTKTVSNEASWMRDELIKPFAPAHFVSLIYYADSNVMHAVAMDKDGQIFDPSPDAPEDRGLADAYYVRTVMGVFSK